MKAQRLTLALTALNLVLLLLLAVQARPTLTQAAPAALRGRVIELVDDRGRVRSRLPVETGGEIVLRLMDQDGTIRVKLGASRDGSGLVLLDEATEPGVHLVARRTASAVWQNTTGITLKGKDGRQRVIRP